MQREAEERLAKAKRDVPRQSSRDLRDSTLKRQREADDQDNELEVPPWSCCYCLLRLPPNLRLPHRTHMGRASAVASWLALSHAFCGAKRQSSCLGHKTTADDVYMGIKVAGAIDTWYGKLFSLCCYTIDYLGLTASC